VKEIEIGMSGALVHMVTTDSGEYVLRRVRVPRPPTWEREMAIHRLVSAHGIAPRLEWVDESAAATVSARIRMPTPAGAFGDAESRPRVIASLVATLAKLHAIPLDGVTAADPLVATRDAWSEQSVRPGFPDWAMPLADHVDECERLLASDPRRVLSHNDLNPANILWDGERVWLVDWEVSGATHPYYDLAVASLFLMLDDATGLALLGAQERATLTPEQVETFRALRRLANTMYGAIFMKLAPELTGLVPSRLEDAPTLAQVYAMLGSGALSLRSSEGKIAFGSAVLRQALER
jgi:aminoglycoside phosphotransferase (APT) family kinase protein